MSNNLLDYVGLGYFLSKIKTLFVTALGTSGNNLTWTKNGTTNNITIPYATEAGKLSILLTKTYENVLRNNATYTSPYTNSYLYFGSVKTTDLTRPSHVKYRVLAYAPSNANFLLESIVEWYFGNNGIYKGYYIWNNLSSTSYYPFYCHTLYSAKTAAIATSDGSYLGCYYGTSTSYGQSPNTVARTIKIEILECNNCTVSLLDNVVWLVNTDNVPANLKLPSTSKAYNDTNFTANNVVTSVGLQETGDANSDTVGYSIRTNSYSKPMKSALGYGYRLLFTSGDKLGWVPANNSSSSNATAVRTPTTDPIDPFGEIVYYGGANAVAAGSRPSATTLWELYTITLGYSFNTTGAALTLTSWKPVYIKCTPLEDGSATLEGYTQDLPTEEDGFIYIYLGVAYNATAVELVIKHPIYYFKDGLIRLWTGRPYLKLLVATYYSSSSTLDTTWEVIQENISNGGRPYLILVDANSNKTPLLLTYVDDLGRSATFLGVSVSGGEVSKISAQVSSNGTVSISNIATTNISGKEDVSNKVTSISSSSTDTQYPSAKAVLELVKGHDYSKDYLTLVARSSGTFKFSGTTTGNTIQYSTDDGETWSTAAQVVEVNVNNGDKVLWKGNMTPSKSLNIPADCGGCGKFSGGTATFDAQGNPMSLIFGDNYVGQTSLVEKNNAFASLFAYSNIISAENLFLNMTLVILGYAAMFYGCTSLTTAPALPSTTLAISCYWGMFSGCTSLTTAPQLPAATLAVNCYNSMFKDCTSLTTAPQLPATTLANSCYNQMFSGCTSLNSIKMLATDISANNCLNNWVNGVAATGTFIKKDTATWNVSGVNGVPTGWTVYTESEYEVVRHYELATTSANGLMSSSDKTKLNGIAAGALVNVVTSVDTTATAGVNLSLTSGKLDVTVSGGSIASGNGSVVTGGTVYAVTSTLAPKASPALIGTPTAPTAAAGTNTTQIATTAFVKNAVDSKTHYIANLLSGTAANYITEPEFKSVKVNGSSTNSASSSNCVLQYDTTNKCLKFIFN